jgi:glucose-1-phosphate thymidylyltransferase
LQNGHELFLYTNRDLGDNDGSIGVKRVDEPQHYGVVKLDSERVVDLVKNPYDPPSELAIIRVYVIEDTLALFAAFEDLVENDLRSAGNEYQLTDALDWIVVQSADLRILNVEG